MYVFTDCRISSDALRTLSDYGHTPILCLPHAFLDPAIASHPDMLLFPHKDGIFVLADYQKTLQDLCPGLPLVPIGQSVGAKYPHDVLLNAALVGQYLLCRPDAVAKELLLQAQENGVTVLPVRQGYAKCNVCIVSEHAAITEDAGIARVMRDAGIDVLQIFPGHVALPGYAHGFIGGASGNDGRHVFFCGDLAKHPDGAYIADFCQKHGRLPVSLADHMLTDLGSLLFFRSTE